jgi:uncharacterized protein (TIGR00266 family)
LEAIMIEFTCESCHKQYQVADEFAGKTAKCKQCGNVLQIPSLAVEPQTEAVVEAEAATTAPATSRQTAAAAGESSPGAREVLSGDTGNLRYEISQRPDFALVGITLQPGQKVFAEPSAMASMTPSISLKAGFKGGLGKTLGRALGGESLIINTFEAVDQPGELTFAGGAPGDAAYYRLTGNTLYLQRGAFMLHSDGVEVSGKWQGAKGFFSGEGLILLKATGNGDIFFNSYGAILQIDVTDEYIVDSGYIVAFEDTLQYNVTVLPGLRAGGKLKSFFFGGEGLVCRFSGQGKVWIQTRHVHSFLSWVNPFRPTKSN